MNATTCIFDDQASKPLRRTMRWAIIKKQVAPWVGFLGRPCGLGLPEAVATPKFSKKWVDSPFTRTTSFTLETSWAHRVPWIIPRDPLLNPQNYKFCAHQLKVNWNQLKKEINWKSLEKINWNHLKITWNLFENPLWNLLNINWSQLNINWNQLKGNWNQLNVNWNQFKVNWTQLKVHWNQLIQSYLVPGP